MYGVVFLAALAVDAIPLLALAPPAWTIAVFLLVKFRLNPFIVLLFCASGSTLGRYLMSLYIPRFAGLFIKRHKRDDLEFMGKKLSKSLWQSWLFVFIYSVTPLSTTALFTAAGVAKVKPSHTLPPFFCGKFMSDAIMIFTGFYAAKGNCDTGLGFSDRCCNKRSSNLISKSGNEIFRASLHMLRFHRILRPNKSFHTSPSFLFINLTIYY